MFFSYQNSRCHDLSSPSIANFIISIIIFLGILVSYLPQHYRIIARRSSAGLSPYFILLGATSSTCAVANILVLPLTRTDFQCCKEISPFACTAALLGIAQVGMQWSCFFLIMLLFLIFFPRSTSTTSATSSPPATKKDAVPAFRDALIVVVSSIIFIIAVFIISVFILANYQSHAQSLANVMGIMSAILASIQYLPQLYTTWKLQTVLSLSIPMMCIQTPGSFVWAASLAARVGWEGWSAWAVYVFTGMLQGILLGMGIAFELRDYRKRREDQTNGVAANGTVAVENEGGEDADQQNLGRNDETTPLLRTSSRG